ncbi:MAG: hypothetical protein L0207_03590 [Chlamydiae bacterium]|nr:hypothetical protein [Chlamydiota bacterium]
MRKVATLLQAIDNLSSMAEADLEVTAFERKDWKDPKYLIENKDLIKETFQILTNYLYQLYEREKDLLLNEEIQKAIQAMMFLAGEAVLKLDRNLEELEEKISNMAEYKKLNHYYLTKVIPIFRKSGPFSPREKEEVTPPSSLQSLEIFRSDQSYELLFIKKEDGQPFYQQDFLRHLKLIKEADNLTIIGKDNPRDWILNTYDREIFEGAKEMINLSKPYFAIFYEENLHLEKSGMLVPLNKALMALMLAASEFNLKEEGREKSCLEYYGDFHFYLRESLTSDEYKKFIDSGTTDRKNLAILNLCHALCFLFFMRMEKRKDSYALFRKFLEKEIKKTEEKPAHLFSEVWDGVLDADTHFRSFLKGYPLGPMFKSLELIEENQLKKVGFDPILQKNYPDQLYIATDGNFHVTVIRLPSPTSQSFLGNVKVVEEFLGFLRFLKREGKRHLLIDLQNSNLIQERAQKAALSRLSEESFFRETLSFFSLDKSNDFYDQKGEYQNLEDSREFLEAFKKHLTHHEFSSIPKSVLSIIPDLVKSVFSTFFSSNEILIQTQRLSFIEITHFFLVLKWIETTSCDVMSFTCKDGLDVGAAMGAGFFAFLHLLQGTKKWEEEDFLLFLLYHPALIVRERAIHFERFIRTIKALSFAEEALKKNRSGILKEFSPLFDKLDLAKIHGYPLI